MSWTPEQKEANRLKRIEKWGSEENYRKHMRDIASFKPSIESIEKQMQTKSLKYGKDVFQRWGSKGGKAKRVR